MQLLNYIYLFFIGSLEYVFDFVFTIAYYLTDSAGLSIVALSCFVNLIMIPIRKKADEISKEEKDKQASMKTWVDKIKKAFKGDEQYMILQTYYRQNNYKPIYSLKSSISLLIQIPFFIAAYSYLNSCQAISGASFLFIENLSICDGLLFGANLLPILMTIISIISDVVFTNGSSIKDNIQLYLLSIVFLIILYNAPSGLVMYYLLNNMFSLLKNIFDKIPNKETILARVLFLLGVLGLLNVVFVWPLSSMTKEFTAIVIFVIMTLPAIIKKKINLEVNIPFNVKSLIISEILIIIILGLFIPSNVIESSPTDFAGRNLSNNPVLYLVESFFIASGLLGFWLNILIAFSNNNIKKIFGMVFQILSFVMIINYLFFGRDMGILSKSLVYQDSYSFNNIEYITNLFIDIIILIIICVFVKHRVVNVTKLSIILLSVLLILSFINIYKINVVMDDSISRINSEKNDSSNISVKLSSEKENVIIIVLDRAISAYFPYIVNENEDIKEAFSDFTYYPNTLSFGCCTSIASPALYAGYDYTMYEMNKDDEKKLVEKHNEALMTMPVLFVNNGFEVTVFDQQFANYEDIPDLSIYDGYEKINAYNAQGRFDVDDFKYVDVENNKMGKIFLSFSFAKTAPLLLFNAVYNYGIYNSINNYFDKYEDNIYISNHLDNKFYDSYAVLERLPDLIQIENESDCLFIMHSVETHEPELLQMPNYEMANGVNNSKYARYNVKNDNNGNIIELEKNQLKHYCVNMSALKQLSVFIEYLKDNDMYDNSRIIVVSDHGFNLNLYDEVRINSNEENDITELNPLLLFKDFNTNNAQLTIDIAFMTNADVPTIATNNIINNPTNPFTGLPINSNNKENAQIVTFSKNWGIYKDLYTREIDEWYSVKDNIFVVENWNIYSE